MRTVHCSELIQSHEVCCVIPRTLACACLAIGIAFLLPLVPPARAEDHIVGPRFVISRSGAIVQRPITGRVFLLISRNNEPEVRLQSAWLDSPQFFGVDAKQLKPGQAAVVDAATLGYPFRSLKEIPPGTITFKHM